VVVKIIKKNLLRNFFLSLIVVLLIFSFAKQKNFSFSTVNSFKSSSKSLINQPNRLFVVSQGIGSEPIDFNIIQGNSLIEASPSSIPSIYILGVLTNNNESSERKDVIEYIVQKEDTFATIAKKFGISIQTILWANNLSEKSEIHAGQKLIILPISGILYQVKEGDTLDEIAKIYKGKIEEIIAFNELSSEKDIYVNDFLIIPNGVLPVQPKKSQIKNFSSREIPLASSYFIYPTVSHFISQGFHWFNAIDFAGQCGDPIYAVAAGEILRVKFGWNFGIGNYVRILHPNGVTTLYCHLQSILVQSETSVSQGQIIGYMGGKPGTPGSGNSTGCHLHFGVYNTKNPFIQKNP